MDVTFAYLLCLMIPVTCISLAKDGNCDINNYVLVLITQILCVVNLTLNSQYLQLILHDIFVYMIVYGTLSSECHYYRYVAIYASVAMVISRMYYKRCIFLWWHTERNIDYDFIVLLGTIINLFRKNKLLNLYVCILISLCSHFMKDEQKNSFIFKFFKLVKSI